MRLPHARFKKTVFENGLTLISEQRPGLQAVAMGVWVKTGTRFEPAPLMGVSHFLEHMLFKGTQTRSPHDIAIEVEKRGGDINAFTAREYTCFQILIRKQYAEFGAEILSDILLNSTFDRLEMEKERKVILQEISMVEENPEELAFDLLYSRAFAGKGLGQDILGTRQTIRRLSRQSMVRYFRQFYKPDRLVISVAGDVSHAELKRNFRALGRWKLHGGASKKPLLRGSTFHPGFAFVRRRTEQAHLVVGIKSVPYNSVERIPSILLNQLLGVGMSSLLFQEIREKAGLAYTVYSHLSAFRDAGLMSIYVGTSPARVTEAYTRMEKIFGRLTRETFPKRELDAIKENFKGGILMGLDDMDARMSNIAKNELFLGDYVPVRQICKLIDSVKPEDLQRMAQKHFVDAPRFGLLIAPECPSRLSGAFSRG